MSSAYSSRMASTSCRAQPASQVVTNRRAAAARSRLPMRSSMARGGVRDSAPEGGLLGDQQGAGHGLGPRRVDLDVVPHSEVYGVGLAAGHAGDAVAAGGL